MYIIIFLNEKGKRAHFQSWLHDTFWIIKTLTTKKPTFNIFFLRIKYHT